MLHRARRVARMVSIAANHGPYRASCLPRSLLTWWLLRRQGIATALLFGVNREGGAFSAHAWVELDGVVINDGPQVAKRHAPFDADLATIAPRNRQGRA